MKKSSYLLKNTLIKEKNTLISGNAGDEKNLHPGGRNFIFFNQFNGYFSNKVYT